ncbi:MAG: acyl-CoA thioesterase domain-containing protein [Pseudomonadales bacterium]
MSALEELLELLALERIEENLFRAYHPKGRKHRLFGGQIMAQALRAAAYTIEPDRPPHSLHGYFLRPGDPAIPALIDVERIRDGKSFSTRRVVVIQHGQAIFNMDVSFQIVESGFNHQLDMPEREVPIVEMVPEELRQAPFLSWRHDHKRLLSDVPQQP